MKVDQNIRFVLLKIFKRLLEALCAFLTSTKLSADVWNDQHQILIIKSQGKKFTDQILQIFTIERK